jgi:hypothetical protein
VYRLAYAAGRGKAAPSGAGFSTPIVLAHVDNSFAIVSHRWRNGALAQLGERLLCKHQVIGSIPIGSTTANTVSAASVAQRAIRRSFAATDGARHPNEYPV